MLRKTGHRMMLRRTPMALGGGEAPMPYVAYDCGAHSHCPSYLDAPKADDCVGIIPGVPYSGALAPLRFIDPIWWASRFTDLGRDGFMAGPLFWLFLWTMWWYLPQQMVWGDGKPPKSVDWNKGGTGYLVPPK